MRFMPVAHDVSQVSPSYETHLKMMLLTILPVFVDLKLGSFTLHGKGTWSTGITPINSYCASHVPYNCFREQCEHFCTMDPLIVPFAVLVLVLVLVPCSAS